MTSPSRHDHSPSRRVKKSKSKKQPPGRHKDELIAEGIDFSIGLVSDVFHTVGDTTLVGRDRRNKQKVRAHHRPTTTSATTTTTTSARNSTTSSSQHHHHHISRKSILDDHRYRASINGEQKNSHNRSRHITDELSSHATPKMSGSRPTYPLSVTVNNNKHTTDTYDDSSDSGIVEDYNDYTDVHRAYDVIKTVPFGESDDENDSMSSSISTKNNLLYLFELRRGHYLIKDPRKRKYYICILLLTILPLAYGIGFYLGYYQFYKADISFYAKHDDVPGGNESAIPEQ